MIEHTAEAGYGPMDEVCNITQVIETRALQHPAALALILPDRLVSYRELVSAVHVIARQLLASGVQPGQVVGVSMGQTALHLTALLAIARIGAVSVPVHPALTLERRELAARRFGASAIVSGRSDLRIEGLPFIMLRAVDLAASAPTPPPVRTRAHDPCWISLSSGTSGDPKGVLRSHGYMLDRVPKSTYSRTRESRLLPMDLNFGIGFGQSMRMLVSGGAVVLAPDNLPANLAYMVRSHAVTHWLLSPALADDILLCLDDDDVHFPSVVSLQIVGASPSPRLLDALFKKFTPNVNVNYGTSEVGPVAAATPEILHRAPTSVGAIMPWVKLEIVDSLHQPVPTGQTGRMRLKMDGMFNGYHLDPELTAERFHEGWYYPQDSAWLDAEGLLYIDGREDDVLVVGGGKIYFREIETALESHPSVREAAAFVLANSAGRDSLAVAVVLSNPEAVDALMAWAAKKLGPICPEQLVVADNLPRTATGKVLRDQLAKSVAPKPV